ncbi:MAG: hypothetical protein EOP06_01415 [Proteobacteria bacterium]|nr:MAG: hypothetical protein EOP06_01415 [Pseudomonadota bacterium]
MLNFSYESKDQDRVLKFEFKGLLDEHAKLPVLNTGHVVEICLRNVTGLNSTGTRLWCQWVRAVPSNVHVRLLNCPAVFIKCFNQVHGSLAPNIRVQSFYVPFYSDKTGERVDTLYTYGVHFGVPGKKAENVIFDSQMNEMELDVFPDFFDFLGTKP